MSTFEVKAWVVRKDELYWYDGDPDIAAGFYTGKGATTFDDRTEAEKVAEQQGGEVDEMAVEHEDEELSVHDSYVMAALTGLSSVTSSAIGLAFGIADEALKIRRGRQIKRSE